MSLEAVKAAVQGSEVVMPERIDDELKRFAESWRASHGYDPRRKLKEQA